MKLSDRILSFGELIQTQDELNTLMAGDKWKANMTPAQYVVQIGVELNELLCDSGVKYKWWKKHDDSVLLDNWNLKIEIIDALHFALSAHILVIRSEIATHEDADYRNSINEQISTMATEMFLGIDAMTIAGDNTTPPLIVKEDGWIDYDMYAQLIADSMLYINTQQLSYLDLFRLSYCFMLMLTAAMGLTTQEISAIYSAKATLNRIRMSSGYKQGKYVKIEDGIEDNARLEILVNDFLNTPTMSLRSLERNVRNKFFVTK
ncbi:hypothetical protein [Alishewanella phage vB_AspM_Slickus01]|nr:hypothetical protein [Alishewanella phage vB_AspM_Slickus01]